MMIDSIKLFTVINEQKYNYLKSFIDFTSKVNLETSEIIGSTEIGYYRVLKITLRKKYALTIQGSLHKAFNNGVNYNDFTYLDYANAVKTLCNELQIEAEEFTIQRIELGVNIQSPILSFSTIESNLLLHKLTPFSTFIKDNKIFGYYCKHQRFCIKIYDKSAQENLENEVLRLEYKVTKMQHLKAISIKKLTDVLDKSKIEKVRQLILKDFSYILMDNCEVIEKCTLPPKESNFYLKARDVKYWKRLKTNFSQSTCTTHQRKFKRLIKNYAKQDLTIVLNEMLTQKWQILANN
jgi:hypothetical protein